MNFILYHVDGQVHVLRFPGEHTAPGCTMRRRQASGGSVMLWAMFCWENLGSAIHVDVTLTHTTYLSNVADHVHPFMEMVFPDGCGLFQQDNAPCHKAKWFRDGLMSTTTSLRFLEDCYGMRDPFTPNKDKFLILGSKCSLCKKTVCVGTDCSIFYTKRFCLPCVRKNLEQFPEQIQIEIAKKKTAQKS
ncbi:hypothetical protein QTP70_033217 [Hemibagrus guttatus]|uniref:Cysteine-rich DPF motif domain-containing protein 1 n=1 Tax=Hemibagrus guttatus TaxID=175788 RepID=A0AAE0UUM1_9TELE|nr:hypothetical protein QTP70_033217 [Hemibagrus guttatus]KAK3544682.1 hypothetical protein QTP86_026150 [Hemibagrus guttatus]